VQELSWRGSGPVFSLFWGGRDWTLNVSALGPGLCRPAGADSSKLLAIDRLERAGRPACCDAFSGATLVDYDRYRSKVRATYAPPSWGGLIVRASWSVIPEADAVDLEVQLTASSVGELDGVLAGVVSRHAPLAVHEAAMETAYIEAREASVPARGEMRGLAAAAWAITSFSASRPLRPCLYRAPDGTRECCYVEMVHPDDLAWRATAQPAAEAAATVPGQHVRYGLFGLSIEKGVILRARLRGCWIRSANPEETARGLYEEFLAQPPPLGP
jgi:hypothetical protein